MQAKQKRGRRDIVTGPLFGAPSADHDRLLKQCTVDSQIDRYLNPIITGRWGTGKSAILITRAKKLEQVLTAVDESFAREWYIREQDLNTTSIFALQKQFAETKGAFINTLQDIWKSEIIRRTTVILAKLRMYYSGQQGYDFVKLPHWRIIDSFVTKHLKMESLWQSVENVLIVLFPGSDRKEAIQGFTDFFKELTGKTLYSAIQKCIRDLEKHELVVPIIGIEPLETPASTLDQNVSLAQNVVSALLNCFRNDFIRSEYQRIQVNISVPWNRIVPEEVNFPQHIQPYMDDISWTKNNLRVFINKRIEYEANSRNVKLNLRPNRDAWDSIFSTTVENESYVGHPQRVESSFDYVCRHTLWRARDIQTIARECVELYCRDCGVANFTEFFRKRKKVNQDCIRRAVATNAPENAMLRLEEARRKFRFDFDPYKTFLGMKVPFTNDELRSRFANIPTFKEWAALIQILWDSGIIGYAIDIKTTGGLRYFQKKYGAYSVKIGKTDGRLARGFLFQYNVPDSAQVISMIAKLQDEDQDFAVNTIFHPTFNEYLDLRLDNSGPLGC